MGARVGTLSAALAEALAGVAAGVAAVDWSRTGKPPPFDLAQEVFPGLSQGIQP